MSTNRHTITSDVILDVMHSLYIEKLVFNIPIDANNRNMANHEVFVSYSPSNIDLPCTEPYVAPVCIYMHTITNPNTSSQNIELIFSWNNNYSGKFDDTLDNNLTTDIYQAIRASSLSEKENLNTVLPTEQEFEEHFTKSKNMLETLNKRHSSLIDTIKKLKGHQNGSNANISKLLYQRIHYNEFNNQFNQPITKDIIQQVFEKEKRDIQEANDLQENLSSLLKKLEEDSSISDKIKNQIKKIAQDNTYKQESISLKKIKTNIIELYKGKIAKKILNKLLDLFNDDGDSLKHVYHFMFVNDLERIIKILTKTDIPPGIVIEKFITLFNSTSIDIDRTLTRLLKIETQLSKIERCGLLDQETFEAVFTGNTVDRSCDARLNDGLGLDTIKQPITQERWGYCCDSVQRNLIKMMQKKSSLKDILEYAVTIRKKIALVEQNDGDFGSPRTNLARDFYVDEGPSVINKAIFPSIKETVSAIRLDDGACTTSLEKLHEACLTFFSSKKCYLYEWENVSHKGISLPKETLFITTDENKNIRGVSSIFEKPAPGQVESGISALDDLYFKKFLEKPLSTSMDFLYELGEFVFHLVRLYPYTRGTGAIMQWLTRSILQFHYGEAVENQVNSLCLGKNKDIPYDVYAHLVKTPAEYAVAFKNCLEPLLENAITTVAVKKQ